MADHLPAVIDALDCSKSTAHKRAFSTRPTLWPPLVDPKERPLVKNAILARLSLQDLAAIGETLEPITIKKGMALHEPNKHVEHVYFIESGLASLRIVTAGSMLEAAVVGYRGVVGASFLWGGHLSTHQSVALFAGSARRVHVEDLRRVTKERPEIRKHLFGYIQALTFQCVQTGLCGVRHDREQRLASWLCLASDAMDARMLPVTYDYLSEAFGLRRETLGRFEEHGLIRKMRGALQIDDRKSLEQKACCCYKLVSSAYASSVHCLETSGFLGTVHPSTSKRGPPG
ncbi:CRP-like cAMP-binding protein [Bradyrhizobium sp. USDA 4461]